MKTETLEKLPYWKYLTEREKQRRLPTSGVINRESCFSVRMWKAWA